VPPLPLPKTDEQGVGVGIGAAGTAIVRMLVLGESAALLRLLCIGLILAGVIGLRLVNAS
jgi:quaternary ammonium compound-resistance protein SugE